MKRRWTVQIQLHTDSESDWTDVAEASRKTVALLAGTTWAIRDQVRAVRVVKVVSETRF